MKKFGLLGEKLGHSFSPLIHSMLGDYAYDLCEISPENLSDFLAHNDYDGFNVTIPYKKMVLSHCDELSEKAKQVERKYSHKKTEWVLLWRQHGS